MPHATEIEVERSAPIPPLTDLSPDRNAHISVDNTNLNHEFDTASSSPRDVQAQLHYLSSAIEFTKNKPPVQVVAREATVRDPRTTVRLAQGPPEIIHDVRGREDEFTLERNGFQYVRNKPRFQDWDSRDRIWTEYIEELKELVACAFGGLEGGVDEVIAFHEGKRGSNKEWRQAADGQRTNPFARQVHVDQSEPTIRQIVKEKTDIKGDWLWKGRVRQVNAWRPLYHPVYDCGLCVADASTVRESDLIETNRIRESDGTFLDTMGVVQYREGRDWYYKSVMDPDDVVLFMGYDSDCARGKNGGTGFTLHSAFDIPNPPPGSPPRASIEVRLLVFTWPKEPLVISRPLAGMLTTQIPPRNEEVYETHHTGNVEVEGYCHQVVTLPDENGGELQIDLNDYDPFESPGISRSNSSSTSPFASRRSSVLTRTTSHSLGEEITEAQVTYLADQRVSYIQQQIEELQKQLKDALKTKVMMSNPRHRKTMVNLMNVRRSDELGKQRLELARRLRGSLSGDDVFFDL